MCFARSPTVAERPRPAPRRPGSPSVHRAALLSAREAPFSRGVKLRARLSWTSRTAALALAFATAACVLGESGGRESGRIAPTVETKPNEAAGSVPSRARIDLSRDVREAIARGEERRVLVGLAPPTDDDAGAPALLPEAGPPVDSGAPCSARASSARATLRRAGVPDARALVSSSGARLLRAYRHVPFASVALRGERALAALAADPRTHVVVDDVPLRASLAHSLPLLHQPDVIAAGHDGTGTTVAVLDTGVDYRRSAFGACAAPGDPGCKVALARDFATDDGARDAHGHGTNVAGIVLGVAPGARIAALDVFDGDFAWSSDILAAVEWVLDVHATEHIVAMNLSLGGGSFSATCGSQPVALAIAAAREQGVLTAVASGNEALVGAMAYPACAPAAISVGAVWTHDIGGATFPNCRDAVTGADRVTCFSNVAPWLTILAPGAPVTAAGITMYGTSQAAPHVAGAIALLRAAFPDEDAERTARRLVSGGARVTDPRVGLDLPRLDVAGAFAAVEPPPTPAPDAAADADAAPPCP